MLLTGNTFSGVSLAIIAAVNSVVAAFYYLNIMKQMWFLPSPEGTDESKLDIPAPLVAALGITLIVTIVTGTVLAGPLRNATDFLAQL